MSGFDKFEWIKAVRDGGELAPGVKYVLQNIALEWVLNSGDGALYVRQARVAEVLCVSIRQVKNAYADARRLGYFVRVKRRQSGARRHAPDQYRLTIPGVGHELGANCAPNSESGAWIERVRCTDRQSQVQIVPPSGANGAPDVRQKNTDLPAETAPVDEIVKGIEQGEEKGEEQGVRAAPAAAPPPPPSQDPREALPTRPRASSDGPGASHSAHGGTEPGRNSARGASSRRDDEPPICKRHPDGNSEDPCAQCKRVREHNQAIERDAKAEQREAERKEGIEGCNQCDDDGFVHQEGLDQQTKFPLVFAPPSGGEVPDYVCNWLAELGDPPRYQLLCAHGTNDDGDDRWPADMRKRHLEKQLNFKWCTYEAFVAAGCDVEAGYQIDYAAWNKAKSGE